MSIEETSLATGLSHLDQQLAFILELDRLKAVRRQSTVQSDQQRHENSAEHSWHITLMAQVLQDYVQESVDIWRVTQMLLIHDIVEIDAGDTFAYADESLQEQQTQQELQAAERIFGLLPESQSLAMLALWLEFEEATTADARFAKAMDRFLPLLQAMSNAGDSWVRHGIKKSQVLQRHQYLETISPSLWRYACEQIDLAVERGWLVDA